MSCSLQNECQPVDNVEDEEQNWEGNEKKLVNPKKNVINFNFTDIQGDPKKVVQCLDFYK